MTHEEECMKCKWCNINRMSWWKLIYYKINPFERLYVECYHPDIYWIYNEKRRLLPCLNARVDLPDTDTVTRCGETPRFFEPK